MNLKILYFSPVGTTKRVAEVLSNVLSPSQEWIDLSDPLVREKELIFSKDDTVLMVFPVYAGRVVRIPRYYFKKIKGNGAKVITLVTYGNRAYDDALYELSKLAVESGFLQVAAAAVVCEHSFDIDIANNRPDEDDIKCIESFGKRVVDKIKDLKIGEGDMSALSNGIIESIPGSYPFRTQFRHDFGGPLVPETSASCIACGLCARMCPVLAIPSNDYKLTETSKCITCFRCIRSCPVSARAINLPDFLKHTKWLTDNCQERKEPEVFL